MSEPTKLTAHIPTDLAERLERTATAKQISQDELLEEALRDWLARDEKRYRETLEAIESADRGEFISQEEVDEWAAKLDREPVQSS